MHGVKLAKSEAWPPLTAPIVRAGHAFDNFSHLGCCMHGRARRVLRELLPHFIGLSAGYNIKLAEQLWRAVLLLNIRMV